MPETEKNMSATASTANSIKKVVICGGNGFLGSRICKFAVARGWDVTSISRSGEPRWESVTSSASPPTWAKQVLWEKADLLKPTSYSPLLNKADYVVHTMGILLETDYKAFISGRESPLSALRRAFSCSKTNIASENPLDRKKSDHVNQTQSNEKDGQLTYELMNRDSAISLAHESSKHQVPVIAYISAAGGAPILPKRYISTKREAESTISSEFPLMRGIFFRPGFIYDSSRTITIPLAAMTAVGAIFNNATSGVFGGIMGAAGVKPLSADVVALAVVEALDDQTVKGPVDIKEIEQLAQKASRKSMI